MDDSLWTALMTISVSVSALAIAWDRGWLQHGVDFVRRITRRSHRG